MSKSKFIVLVALIAGLSFLTVFFGVSAAMYRQQSAELQSQTQQAQSEIDSLVSEYDQALKDKSSEINDLNQKIKDLQSELDKAKQQLTSSGTSNTKKTCYLTFDDGPSENTLKILKILKDNNIKATFFVKGDSSDFSYVKNIVEEGHAIGLHTYTHDYKTIYSSDEAYFDDLQKVSDRVFEYTGVRSNIIRFPGGASNTISRNYCSGIMSRITKEVTARGYTYFDWNVDCRDGEGKKTVSQLVSAVKSGIPSKRDACVLMHDAGAKKTTVEALPQIINLFKERGFVFDKLDENTTPIRQKVAN